MQPEGPNAKAKILTGIAVIAAVAIIYFFSMGKAHNASASSSVSDTPLTSSSQPSTSSSAPSASSGSSSSSSSSSSTSYKAGTYSASANYRTPHSFESITVNLSVSSDGTVTDSSIQQSGQDPESAQYQAAFKSEYKQYVVGKKLSDINLQYVSGSSLTSSGFEDALSQIQSQAQQG